MLEFWNVFKNNVAVALLFMLIGFLGGVGTYKYLSDFFNADVVLKNSYVYKTDLEKNYVIVDIYNKLAEKLSSLEKENVELRQQNSKLKDSMSEFSISVCQRY